jgi:hypothetical protein
MPFVTKTQNFIISCLQNEVNSQQVYSLFLSQLLNISSTLLFFFSSPRIVPSSKEDKIISDEDVKDCLLLLFTAFHKNRKEKESLESRYSECSKLMHDVCGFSIERQKSLLENGGRGVFVASGQVQCGSVVAMYPG